MRESLTLLLQCPGPYFGAALQQVQKVIQENIWQVC
ncbi:hypothetical protein Hamer_G025901 [Homarus americanus]|uniref:Uncharacterized protein n=1 Tax=Homarus americanus TaxID=6706 RepID=A0A8J5MKG8_HOMAM|nr:hypothetical protein Hamer_G029584 [Homarus americanus]KAG7165550.1 hypothetical protein Hamer_G025901 [Homarus americanus]